MRSSTASSSYAAIGYLATQPTIYESQHDPQQGSSRQQRRVAIIDFPTPLLNVEAPPPPRTSSRLDIRPQYHHPVHPAVHDPELLSPYYQYALSQPVPPALYPQLYRQQVQDAPGFSQSADHPYNRVPGPSSAAHPIQFRPYVPAKARSPIVPLLAAPPPTAFPPHKRSRASLYWAMVKENPSILRAHMSSAAQSSSAPTGSPAGSRAKRPSQGYVEIISESETDRQRRGQPSHGRERGTGGPKWSRFGFRRRDPTPNQDR